MGRRRATPASSSSPTPASSSPTHSSSPGTSPDAATLRPSPSPPPIAGANSKGSAKGPSPRRSPSLASSTVKPHRPKPRRQPWAGDWSSSWLPGKSPAVDKSFKASPRNHDSYRVKERKERQRQRPGYVAASSVALNSTASPPRYSREQEQQEPQQQHTRLDFSMRSTPRPPSQSRRSRTAEQQQRTTPPRAMSPRSFTVMQGRNVPLLNESAALTADERGWDGRAPVWDNYIPSGGHGSLDGGRLGQTEAFIKRPSSVAGWATRDKQPRVSPLLFTNSMGHCRTHHEPDMPWEVPIDSAYQHPIHNPNRPLTSPMLLTGKLRILDVSQRPPVAMFETYKTEGDSLASTPMPMVLQAYRSKEEQALASSSEATQPTLHVSTRWLPHNRSAAKSAAMTGATETVRVDRRDVAGTETAKGIIARGTPNVRATRRDSMFSAVEREAASLGRTWRGVEEKASFAVAVGETPQDTRRVLEFVGEDTLASLGASIEMAEEYHL